MLVSTKEKNYESRETIANATFCKKRKEKYGSYVCKAGSAHLPTCIIRLSKSYQFWPGDHYIKLVQSYFPVRLFPHTGLFIRRRVKIKGSYSNNRRLCWLFLLHILCNVAILFGYFSKRNNFFLQPVFSFSNRSWVVSKDFSKSKF